MRLFVVLLVLILCCFTSEPVVAEKMKLVFAFDETKLSEEEFQEKWQEDRRWQRYCEVFLYSIQERVQRWITPYNQKALRKVPLTLKKFQREGFPKGSHFVFLHLEKQEEMRHEVVDLYARLLFPKTGEELRFYRTCEMARGENAKQLIQQKGQEIAGEILRSLGFGKKEKKQESQAGEGKQEVFWKSLERKTAEILSSISKQHQAISQLVLGPVVDHKTQTIAPFAKELQSRLEKVVERHPGLEVLQLRSLMIEGFFRLSARYQQKGNRIGVLLQLANPQNQTIGKWIWKSPTVDLSALAPRLPENFALLSQHPTSKPQNTCSLTLQATTNKGPNGGVFHHEEQLQLEFQTSATCYLHIYYLQSNGELLQIFPNSFHNQSKVQGGVVHKIPGPNYSFRFKINAQKSKGMELIIFLASCQPLPHLQGSSKVFGLRGIDIEGEVSLEEIRQRGNVLEESCSILVE